MNIQVRLKRKAAFFIVLCLTLQTLGAVGYPASFSYAKTSSYEGNTKEAAKTPDVPEELGGLTQEEEAVYSEELAEAGDDAVSESFFVKTTEYTKETLQEITEAESVTKGYFEKYLLRFETEEEAAQAYEEMAADPQIEAAFYNPLLKLYKNGSGNSAKNWGDKGDQAMGFDQIASAAAQGNDAVVAVIDTGADPKASMDGVTKLGDRLDEDSWNIYDNSGISDTDSDGHGTHVSGIIAKTTPDNVSIEALGVADRRGNLSSAAIERALVKAVKDEVDVINMSLGEYDTAALLGGDWDEALEAAYTAGIPVCCAAGNYDSTAPIPHVGYMYPACSGYTFAVSAIHADYSLADYSFYDMSSGAGSLIDFTAPGTNINSYLAGSSLTEPAQQYLLSGTSMASPYIAAACAIVACIFQEDYDLTVEDYREELAYYCNKCTGNVKKYGAGLPIFSAELKRHFETEKRPTITIKAEVENAVYGSDVGLYAEITDKNGINGTLFVYEGGSCLLTKELAAAKTAVGEKICIPKTLYRDAGTKEWTLTYQAEDGSTVSVVKQVVVTPQKFPITIQNVSLYEGEKIPSYADFLYEQENLIGEDTIEDIGISFLFHVPSADQTEKIGTITVDSWKNKNYTVTAQTGVLTIAKKNPDADETAAVPSSLASDVSKADASKAAAVAVRSDVPATRILSCKAGKKSVTLRWKKKKNCRYQICYGRKKNFSNAVKKKTSAGTIKIKKLKAKCRYYFKVRTFRTCQGKKYYSKWSPVKKCRTK